VTQPRRGRPRDARIDGEITAAALTLLADVGFERFSVEEVAARAGVAKTTVYRRFPTRDDLLVGALERLNDDLELPDVDLPVRERLVDVLGSLRRRKSGPTPRDRLLHVAMSGYAAGDLQALVLRRVIEPRRAGLRSILVDAVERDELRADLDLDAAVALLVGSTLYLGAGDRRGDAALPTVAATVDCVLAGLQPR